MESVFRKSRRQVAAVTWGKPRGKASCYALSRILGGFVLLAAGGVAFGAEVDNELLRQQQRERARQLREDKTPDVRLDAGQGLSPAGNIPTNERPCFTIDRIILTGDSAAEFAWAVRHADGDGDSPIGRCIGAEGINRILKRIQNALIARGYVTTRVLAPPQNLNGGQLELTLIPGRIRAIRFAEGTSWRATHWNAFPMQGGDLLNLRDIEHALENLKRVPSVDADIQIVPAEGDDARPGESDLVVSWRQAFPLRLTLGADDSGTRATGKYQGNLSLAGHHLLTANDLFHVTWTKDLVDASQAHGTHGDSLHYSIPFGYWQLALNRSRYFYHQTVQGLNQNYIYRGRSTNQDIRLTRTLWRDAVSKTTLGLRGWQRESQNYIDDTEVEIQRRRMAGWELNLGQRHFIRDAILEANLAYRRGTGAMNALPAPEEHSGQGTARPRVITADLQFNQPLAIGDQKLRYNLAWRAQWNDTPLVPQDRFAIAGRYTVRGFDGESILSAERGWLVRNDLGIALGKTGQETYLGLDYGRVGGPATEYLIGKSLAGGVLGLRGAVLGGSYDLFIGKPLHKPEGFRTPQNVAGFTLSWTY